MFAACIVVLVPLTALSAPPTSLPAPAEVDRIKPEERIPTPRYIDGGESAITGEAPPATVPEASKDIHFVLQGVDIQGSTVFQQEELQNIYLPYIDHEVTLDIAWNFAREVTQLYTKQGYFLSHAYVPAQNIKNGNITIKIVEGYIGEVELKNADSDIDPENYVLTEYIDIIKAQRPIKSSEVESFLLKLNDLPGMSFRAVLSAAEIKDEANMGGVRLTLIAGDEPGRAVINFDNYGSRFLGPYEAALTYQTSLFPLLNTTISGLTSLPAEELRYGTIVQSAVIAPDITLELIGSYTQAYPGYNLEEFDIDSTSKSLGLSLNYQLIRQRDENVNLKLTFDGRNTDSEILETTLTRDRVRALRASIILNSIDEWNGYNNGSLTVSRGLEIFGSSDKGDLNLSRGDATPDFTKVEMSLSRVQWIDNDWSLFVSASGQLSNQPLFSSEEYGYGGQAFGRAYDLSEITGEDGISGLAELRLNGLTYMDIINLIPYIFYDIGVVRNQESSSTIASTTSGSSTGFGVRFSTDFHLSGNIGLAFPLTLPAATPIYGYENGHNPRLLLQISQEF